MEQSELFSQRFYGEETQSRYLADRCDWQSCEILVSHVNFSENNANCAEILPKNKVIVLDYVKIYEVAAF